MYTFFFGGGGEGKGDYALARVPRYLMIASWTQRSFLIFRELARVTFFSFDSTRKSVNIQRWIDQKCNKYLTL